MSVGVGESFRNGLQGTFSARGIVVGLLLLAVALANLIVGQSISRHVQEWLFGEILVVDPSSRRRWHRRGESALRARPLDSRHPGAGVRAPPDGRTRPSHRNQTVRERRRGGASGRRRRGGVRSGGTEGTGHRRCDSGSHRDSVGDSAYRCGYRLATHAGVRLPATGDRARRRGVVRHGDPEFRTVHGGPASDRWHPVRPQVLRLSRRQRCAARPHLLRLRWRRGRDDRVDPGESAGARRAPRRRPRRHLPGTRHRCCDRRVRSRHVQRPTRRNQSEATGIGYETGHARVWGPGNPSRVI